MIGSVSMWARGNGRRWAVVVWAAVAINSVSGLPARTSGQTPALPEGPGVEKVRIFCSLCHGLDLVAQQRLNHDGWVRVVDQMVEFGAPVLAEDRQGILTYLATYLNPEAAGFGSEETRSR